MSRYLYARAGAAAFLIILFFSGAAGASDEFTYWGTYDARVPVGSIRSFVGDVSWQGVGFQATYSIGDVIAVGGAFEYNFFEENFPSRTIAIPNGALTAPSTRYVAAWTISPSVTYLPLRSGVVRPFAELQAGPVSVVSATLASDITIRNTDVSLFVQPTAGVFVRLTAPEHVIRERDIGFGLVASVSWAFTTAAFENVDFFSYFGGQVGVFARY
jgi:hypothetical protein